MAKSKVIGVNFLHPHPQLEKSLNLDEHHIIVDRKDWEDLRLYLEKFDIMSESVAENDLKIKQNLEKKFISTLECNEIYPSRVCGNSTRQINFAIDHLLKGYTVLIRDHYANGENGRSNILLLDNILKRLNSEHLNVKEWIDSNRLIINRQQLTIKLIFDNHERTR